MLASFPQLAATNGNFTTVKIAKASGFGDLLYRMLYSMIDL